MKFLLYIVPLIIIEFIIYNYPLVALTFSFLVYMLYNIMFLFLMEIKNNTLVFLKTKLLIKHLVFIIAMLLIIAILFITFINKYINDPLIFAIFSLLILLITWKLIPYVKGLEIIKSNKINLSYFVLMLPKFLFDSFVLNKKL